MSYEILYNKQFLKTQEGKYIPIILSGSNNCYQVQWNGKERRSRKWSICNMPHWCNYKIDFTEEELLKEQEQWLDREQFYVVNGKYVNGKQWYNLVKNAIKNAKTIEELDQYDRPVAYLHIWKNDNGKSFDSHTDRIKLNNSQDLQDFIKMYNERLKEKQNNEAIYPVIDFRVEKFKHQKKGKRQPKEKLNEFYAVVLDRGCAEFFVQQITARRLFYTQYKEYAKQFKTEREALKWITDRNIDSKFNVKCSVQLIA